MSAPELYGLVLSGGRSTRMGRDKALIAYHSKPQVEVARELLAQVCARAFVSCRADQPERPEPKLIDRYDNLGPLAGILTAFDAHPNKAWLVVACDLPFLDRPTLDHLIAHRDPAAPATAYRGRIDGKPEPLCAIYEPSIRDALHEYVRRGITCPRKILMQSDAHLMDLPNPFALENANAPDESARASGGVAPLDTAPPETKRECDACPPKTRPVEVRLYAILREKAGASELKIETAAHTARDLFEELRRCFGWDWPAERFRVAIGDRFVEWTHPVTARDVVHVIPPVAGG